MIDVNTYYPPMPMAAFAQAVRIANQAGMRGKIATVMWIPPQTATQDQIGMFAVDERNPTIDDAF